MKHILRRHWLHIIIATVLSASIYAALRVVIPYQREQRIARKIEAHGGNVVFVLRAPKWIPTSIQARLPCCRWIHWIDLNGQNLPSDLQAELGSLSSVENLMIAETQIDDAGLKHLQRMKTLELIGLNRNPVTDAGLTHLSGLTALTRLELHGTQTTPEGRSRLREALPNCEIVPDP